jgi:hypothetical protein
MINKIVLFVVIVLFPLIAYSADVAPDSATEQGGIYAYHWTIATAQAASGDSSRATGIEFCRSTKTLYVEVSDTTVSVAIKLNGYLAKTLAADQYTACGANYCTLQEINNSIRNLLLTSTIPEDESVVSATVECN